MGLWDEFEDCPQAPPPPCAVWIDDISKFTERDWAALTTRIQEKRMKGLGIGRVVHIVLDIGKNIGEHRPAIVVKVLDKDKGQINVQVMLDSSDGIYEDGVPVNVLYRFRVEYSEALSSRTWHWPEYVE